MEYMLDDIRKDNEPADIIKKLGEKLVIALVMALAIGVSMLFWLEG